MKIIILGAGQVGGTLAANLASEHNDITVVDTNSERLHELHETGHSHSNTQESASRLCACL